jgi:hypothetical protein
MIKIDVCYRTITAGAHILDERKCTRENSKGDEVLCTTKLDALRIQL